MILLLHICLHSCNFRLEEYITVYLIHANGGSVIPIPNRCRGIFKHRYRYRYRRR